MLTIKKNHGLTIEKINMTCDKRPKGLHDALGWNSFYYIVGGPASGKTNLWINLISKKGKFYYKQYNRIYIFSPSLGTVKNKLKLPPEYLINGFDEEAFSEVIKECQENEDERTLIILDDCITKIKGDVLHMLTDAIYNRRHMGLSIWLISQKYNKLDNEIRAVLSHLIMFNKTKKELNSLYNDFVNIDRTVFNNIIDTVFDKKYNFLYIDNEKPEKDKYYKNFDKIIIKDSALEA